MDDMILDMDTFDFSQIDSDLVIEHPKGKEPEAVEQEEVEVEEVVEEVESEEEEEVEEESEEEVVEESEEPEDQEVDFESYEVTLPSGEAVVLSDLVQGYRNAEEVRAMKEEVEAVKRDFEDKSGNLVSMLELAQLEVDSVIQEYEDTDWDELAKEDPSAYAQHRTYLDKHIRRSKDLKAAVGELEAKKAQEAQAAEQAKINEAVVRLQREIPGWGQQKYRGLVDYAVSLGADEDEVLNATDPLVFLALNKAMEFEKGKQAVKAKIKTVGSPKKVARPTSKAVKAPADSAKAAALKKFEQGDASAIFNFLED